MSLFSADGKVLFVGQPSPIVASAYRSAAQSLPSGAITVVDLDTSDFTIGHSSSAITVDLTNNRLTATVPGYYQVSVSAAIVAPVAPTAGSIATFAIFVNGAEVRTAIRLLSASAYAEGFTSTVVYLAAGGYADFRIFQGSGSSINTRTAANERPLIQMALLR